MGQACGFVGGSKKASDSGYAWEIDLTGSSDRFGV